MYQTSTVNKTSESTKIYIEKKSGTTIPCQSEPFDMVDEADNSNLKICEKIKEVANFIPTDIRSHKKIIVSHPLKIEKVMHASVFYFYISSFPQGEIEIF